VNVGLSSRKRRQARRDRCGPRHDLTNKSGGHEINKRIQALEEEFDDLEEEFFFCGSREARCRCAGRMGAILAELAVL
jgi:hypothetical protein